MPRPLALVTRAAALLATLAAAACGGTPTEPAPGAPRRPAPDIRIQTDSAPRDSIGSATTQGGYTNPNA